MKKLICRQFCLWTNCNNKCDFCYLKNVKLQNVSEKLSAIAYVKEYVQNNTDFNTIGLIGGEFFQGQLYGCKTEFLDLIKTIADSENIKQVWISASLMNRKQDSLRKVMDLLHLKELYICTSYDIEGRFKMKIFGEIILFLYVKIKILSYIQK